MKLKNVRFWKLKKTLDFTVTYRHIFKELITFYVLYFSFSKNYMRGKESSYRKYSRVDRIHIYVVRDLRVTKVNRRGFILSIIMRLEHTSGTWNIWQNWFEKYTLTKALRLFFRSSNACTKFFNPLCNAHCCFVKPYSQMKWNRRSNARSNFAHFATSAPNSKARIYKFCKKISQITNNIAVYTARVRSRR